MKLILTTLFSVLFYIADAHTQVPEIVTSGFGYEQSELHFADGFVYFGSFNGSQGRLLRVPKAGGVPEIVADNTHVLDGSVVRSVIRTLSTESFVFFDYGGYADLRIEGVAKDLSSRQLLVAGGGRLLDVTDSNIYYFQSFCCMYKLALSGGTQPILLDSNIWPRTSVADEDGFLYLVNLNTRDLLKFDPANESFHTIISGNSTEGWAHTNATSVFLGFTGMVKTASKAGGAVSTISLPPDGFMRGADEDFLYFAGAQSTSLWKQLLGPGSSPELIDADAVLADRVFIDDGYAYWVDIRDGNQNAAIYRVKTGSTGPSIACLGFEPPMSDYPVTARGNRALPLKAHIWDSNGVALTDSDLLSAPVVQIWFEHGTPDATDVSDDALPAGLGTEGNQFVISEGDKWQFNLRTGNYSAPGTYTIFMETGDESEYVFDPVCMTSFVVN